MSSICGHYVDSFAQATHAIAIGINLDAQWDFTWAEIEACGEKILTLAKVGKVRILRDEQGREFVRVRNQHPMGRLFGNRSVLHRALPFVDEATAKRRLSKTPSLVPNPTSTP